MNKFLFGVARAASESFSFPEPVVEIGARQVQGNAPCLRQLFPGKEYLGVDLEKGPGVDLTGNVEDLPLENETAGSVIALNLFEHVQKFWLGFEEIYRVLRPGGVLFVSCPFFLHRHAFPNDYWRFTPDAFSFLLEKYPHKLLGLQGPRNKPLQVWALAVKGPTEAISAETHTRFKNAMRAYAKEPVSFTRRIRYYLARFICGRRPLATFLDVNSWETTLLGNPQAQSENGFLFTSPNEKGTSLEQETLEAGISATPKPPR